jgi:SAM-dependent methyltransferase
VRSHPWKAVVPAPWHPLHYLPKGATAILDIGCNEGAALQYAYELGVSKLFGIDINPQAVQISRRRMKEIRDCYIFHGSADDLPIAESTVDVALCLEVLEHIPEDLRSAVLREIHRVLAEYGRLIITVPARGSFRFLDPANSRLLFPRTFNLVARMVGGKGREAGYESQKHGIVWHHHFSLNELRRLLSPFFRIRSVRWRGGLLAPLCSWLLFPFYRQQANEHILCKIIARIQSFDLSLQLGEEVGYNLLIVAEKVGSCDATPASANMDLPRKVLDGFFSSVTRPPS